MEVGDIAPTELELGYERYRAFCSKFGYKASTFTNWVSATQKLEGISRKSVQLDSKPSHAAWKRSHAAEIKAKRAENLKLIRPSALAR
jgi:hypothetical protein